MFNLLANPFAVLGLAGDASVGTITARAREIGTPDAAAASRALLIPRNRLQAELSFLPGAAQDLAGAALEALKQQREPNLWPPLTLPARANLLAHLAAEKAATAGQLGSLVEMQEAIRSSWPDIVDQAREHARMTSVAADAAGSILETIVNQHADAYAAGMLALPNGADLFVDQLKRTSTDAVAQIDFLRLSAGSWDRAVASEYDKDLETAAPIETALHDDPDPAIAENLAKIISSFSRRTKPSREACRLVGLPHKASTDAAERWRSVALDLNNRQDAVLEAVIVLKALTEGFGTTDEFGGRTAKDLEICRERLTSGQTAPEVRRLAAAIEAAITTEIEFQRLAMANGQPTAQTPPVAVELHDAFIAATRAVRSDLPWQLLRAFTLRLHNEFSATEAALVFTQLAITQGRQTSLTEEMARQLDVDLRELRKQTQCAEFTKALQAKQMWASRRLLVEIIALTDDPKERGEFQTTLRTLTQRLTTRTLKFAFWGAVAIFGLFSVITSNNTTPSYRTAPTPYQSAVVPPSAVADPDIGQPERQPLPGTAVLTRSELRWCRYQDARANAARDYMNGLDPNANVSQYNAAVDAFNAFITPLNASCLQSQYRHGDGEIIDSELLQKAVTLRAEGLRIIGIVPQPVPVYHPAPPAAPVQAAASISPQVAPRPNVKDAVAYYQGQTDIRSWLAWFGPLTGAYRDGAEWWASQRSLRSPPSCDEVPGTDHDSAFAGCVEARQRLAGSDRRRKTEPDYKAGWNNP